MEIEVLVPIVVAILASLMPLVTDLLTTVQASGRVKDYLTLFLAVVIAVGVVAARHGPEVDGLSWDTVWYLTKWFITYATVIFGAAHIAWRTVWKPTGVSGNLNENHGFTLENNNFRP